MKKSLKTPLRYPGGKSRAVQKMAQFFPNLRDYAEYKEPFIGGGSVAIYISQMFPHLNVWVNDLYKPLVTFWVGLRDEPEQMVEKLKHYKTRHPDRSSAKGLFNRCKDVVNDENVNYIDRAVAFYIVNKCSFSGLSESSSFSPQASENNFTWRGIEKLPEFSNIIKRWTITNYTYDRFIQQRSPVVKTFIYLDPPYEIKSALYGKKGSMHKHFDHEDFAKVCDTVPSDTLISYNSSQLIRDRFKSWQAVEFDHTYTMRSTGDYTSQQKERKELCLLNYKPMI